MIVILKQRCDNANKQLKCTVILLRIKNLASIQLILLNKNVRIKINKILKCVCFPRWCTCFSNILFITLHTTVPFFQFITDKIHVLQKERRHRYCYNYAPPILAYTRRGINTEMVTKLFIFHIVQSAEFKTSRNYVCEKVNFTCLTEVLK